MWTMFVIFIISGHPHSMIKFVCIRIFVRKCQTMERKWVQVKKERQKEQEPAGKIYAKAGVLLMGIFSTGDSVCQFHLLRELLFPPPSLSLSFSAHSSLFLLSLIQASTFNFEQKDADWKKHKEDLMVKHFWSAVVHL